VCGTRFATLYRSSGFNTVTPRGVHFTDLECSTQADEKIVVVRVQVPGHALSRRQREIDDPKLGCLGDHTVRLILYSFSQGRVLGMEDMVYVVDC